MDEWVFIAGKVLLVLLMSSLMPITAVTFFRFRLKKKEREFKKIIEIFRISDNEANVHAPSIKNEYDGSDYVLPVVFCTLVSIAGFALCLFGADLLTENVGRRNVLLTGLIEGELLELQSLRWESTVVIVLAFLGGFVWSSQTILRRLVTADLTPGNYYNAGIRMILAGLVALALSWVLYEIPAREYVVPALALLAGMFPDRALFYLENKTRIFSRQASDNAHRLPIEMIEGVSSFHKIRLAEVGIDNAQNLAEANLIELLLITPFPPKLLIDWIAQAKLYTSFKGRIDALRGIGIRTVFELLGCEKTELDEMALETGISPLQLGIYSRRIESDSDIHRLVQFRDRLSAGPPRQ